MKSKIVASFYVAFIFFFNVSKLLAAIQQLRFINYVRIVNEKQNNDEMRF